MFRPDFERHDGCSSAAGVSFIARFSSDDATRLRPRVRPLGRLADAQRFTPTTDCLRCPVRAGLRGRRLRFDRCHFDGPFTRQVRRHPRYPCFARQLRWRYGHGRSDDAARMRLVRLLGCRLDHWPHACVRPGERTTADAGNGQPRWDRPARRHRREWRTGAYPPGSSTLPLRAFLH